MIKKLLCVLLTLAMVFAFFGCGKDKNSGNEKDASLDKWEEPQKVEDTNGSVDDMSYQVPEGFGVLETDNDQLPGVCYENKKGIQLDIETIGPSGFGDFDASSADGVIKSMTSSADSVKDVTIGKYSGKKYTVKENGKLIEMGLVLNVDGSVYFANFYGEDENGNPITIDKKSQESFDQFCKTIKL